MTAVALVLVAVNCLVALASPRTNTADLCVGAAGASNPIAAENTCLGTRHWLAVHPFGPDDAIEGYSNPVSAQAGDTVHLYVSTTAPQYSFTVYRLGWYRGLGARFVYASSTIRGIKQPAPTTDSATRMVSAASWRDPIDIVVPGS